MHRSAEFPVMEVDTGHHIGTRQQHDMCYTAIETAICIKVKLTICRLPMKYSEAQ